MNEEKRSKEEILRRREKEREGTLSGWKADYTDMRKMRYQDGEDEEKENEDRGMDAGKD